MGKSLVERYEQILSQDPSSSVFVELAKALLERGDSARAITVCEQGLAFHPRSVVARVLWGKSLINLSRPAEAMEQFDRAIAIDRDNPHAYNLIGEVLLRKGLYRSALPLLKRAVALQPDDGRVRQWLEQTERALTGGPAPALGEDTVLETALTESGSIPVSETQQTEIHQAYNPESAASPEPRTVVAAPSAEALQKSVPPPGELPAVVVSEELRSAMQDPEDEPTLAGEPEAMAASQRPVLTPVPLDSAPAPAPVPEAMPGLLGDIPAPDLPPPSRSLVDMPKVEVSSQAALAIAQEYERELREKLRATEEEAQQTFWARHWLKVAVLGILLVCGGVGGIAYFHTRANNQNRTLPDELVRARQLLFLDTRTGYIEALNTLGRALDMDASSLEAQALTAYAHALIYEEYGHAVEHRDQAMLGLARAGVREGFPGLSLVAEYYTVPEDGLAAEKKQVLASKLDDAEVQVLAGKLLLAQGDSKGAVERLQKALDRQPNSVRAWIALASYYRTHDDCDGALKMYAGVPAKTAPDHPERVIGAAECRLTVVSELDAARQDLEKLKPEGLRHEQQVRRALALARVYGQTGDAAKAVKLLDDEARRSPERIFDFQLALGDALRRTGDWEGAQRSADAALRSRPDSEEAKELVGRLLIGRDREREALTRFPTDDGRRVRLVRAAALVRLGEWKQARAELQKTQVGGKFPSEAIIYLALADAAEGQVERAQAVLERVLASTKRARGEVQLALGRVYWQRGLVDKARAQFEEAAKDPDDYEGSCSLGRLLLSLGMPEEASAPLTVSVQRNGFHGEGREALSRALLDLGKAQDALTQLETWQRDNPSSPALHRDLAFALLQLGPSRLKEADAAAGRALRLAPKDPATYRIHAMVLFARADVKGGFAALERANKLNPKDGETFCAIGQAFLRRANLPNAQKAFDAAHREGPTLPCARVGSVLVKPAGGRPLALELATLSEQAPQVWDRSLAESARTRVLLALGNVKDARAAAENAVRLGPFSGEAQLAAALVAVRARDDAKARAAFERATQLEPGDARVHLAFADTLAHSGPDAARALNEYQLFLRLADHAAEVQRVKRALPLLKKRIATR